MIWILLWLFACWGDNAYIVKGTVVEVRPGEVVLDHKEIKGLMGPMTMPFEVRDADALARLEPGDLVLARFHLEKTGGHLAKIRVTGKGPVPQVRTVGPKPLSVGDSLKLAVPLHDGTELVLGRSDKRVALTFLYTRCPLPEFCPAIVLRLQALQEQIAGEAQIVALTLDPDYDTEAVLAEFAESSSARPDTWHFGRLDSKRLGDLAMRSALPVARADGQIQHGMRLLVLDSDGRLIERYDDNRWPLERVVEQLRTGGPDGPAGSSGTLTPEP